MKSLAHFSIDLESPHPRQDAFLTVTIVICTRFRPASLRACLERVAKLERIPDEVIVVDNTSGDNDTETVAKEFGAIYTIEPIPGVSRARNRGLANSHSDIVAYLDDDVTFEEQWLEHILKPFQDPKVAVVAGRVDTPQSTSAEQASHVTRFLSNKDPKWFEIASFGGLGLECNMAFRREACAGQTLFDERLGRGAPFQIAEGNYAFALLLSQGYTAVYLPDAVVFHRPLTFLAVQEEARNRVAFSMLLFSEFPEHRMDLLRFLFRRALRKPLTWPRDSPDPGKVVTSGWRVLISAAISAALLFFRTKKTKNQKH